MSDDEFAEEVVINNGKEGIDQDFERFATDVLFAVILNQLPDKYKPNLIAEMSKHEQYKSEE